MQAAEAVQVIEQDVEEVEKNCEKINCVAVRNTIGSFFKLIKDIIYYIFLCKGKKD